MTVNKLLLGWNKMKLRTLIKLKIIACKTASFCACMITSPNPFFYYFYITWSFTNPRRFEKQSILWHRFCSCGWPKTHVAFLVFFILHDNIQALCVAALSAEEQGVVFKNNLKGFTLGINFHTLFFLLFSSCYQKLWCVISPSSSISYSTWKHPQKSVHDISQDVNTQRIQGKYAGLLQCFEEGGFINCQSRQQILSCLP